MAGEAFLAPQRAGRKRPLLGLLKARPGSLTCVCVILFGFASTNPKGGLGVEGLKLKKSEDRPDVVLLRELELIRRRYDEARSLLPLSNGISGKANSGIRALDSTWDGGLRGAIRWVASWQRARPRGRSSSGCSACWMRMCGTGRRSRAARGPAACTTRPCC
jgi:hypothetical protein